MHELRAAPKPRGCLQKFIGAAGIVGTVLFGLYFLGVIVPLIILNGGRAFAPSDNRTLIPTSTPQPTLVPTPAPTPTWTVKQKESIAKGVTYDDLARYTERYVDTYVKMRGKIIQVVEDGNDYVMLVSVTQDGYGFWDDTVMLVCANCLSRPLEDDLVNFTALVVGRQTYETVLGASVTVPLLRWI